MTRALPNPTGKDRTPAQLVTNEQLNGEWIEFANGGGRRLSIGCCSVSHYTFSSGCVKTGEDVLVRFAEVTLEPNQSVRVHTGSGTGWWEANVLLHVYAGRGNYVWNNRCGDTVVLRAKDGGVIDYAGYDAGQRDGAILKRVAGTHRLTESGALARVG